MYKYIRLALLLVIDTFLIVCSVSFAYMLRFDFSIPTEFILTLPYSLAMSVVFILGGFYLFKIYRRIWQYASVSDLLALVKGAFIGTGAFFIFHNFLIHNYFPEIVVPRSIYPLTIIISFLTIGCSRVVWRLIRDGYGKIMPYHRRVLIVGAGEAGVMVVKELRRTRSEKYPVVFVDDNLHKQNFEVMGIPVVGTRRDIPKVLKQYRIDEIIVAIPTASRTDIADIINICKDSGCQIKIVPRMNDLLNGNITINTIRDVSVEDLLGRDAIIVDLNEIADYLYDQVVLVTGAGGSIGSELCRQIAAFNPKHLLLLGRGENSIYNIELEIRKSFPNLKVEPIIADIQHKPRLNAIFKKYNPQVVFHAAAHKHVPLMEKNPIEAVKNNILGTYNVAECAHVYGTKRFVMISTDKAVNPTNVMGASKRVAELIVQTFDQVSDTKFSAVRFGNVLGSRGSVVPLFKRQIEEGGPVTVTHPEMIRYFMTIPEAVQLVIQAGAMSDEGQVFVLDMGQPVKIADLARDLIRLSGLEPGKDIMIEYTGIRPGEKLFEELLTSEEGTTGTKHNRIFIGKSFALEYDQMKTMLRNFEKLAEQKEQAEWNQQEVHKELSVWVDSYHRPDYSKKETNEAVHQALQASLEIVAGIANK
jgi:FlaA1/EpsC-like NDP-sugar epimerase